MIPKTEELLETARYLLLEEDDIINESDEYYNPILDSWLRVDDDFVGNQFRADESKPVRRKNTISANDFFMLCQDLYETTGNSTQLDEDFINLLYYKLKNHLPTYREII